MAGDGDGGGVEVKMRRLPVVMCGDFNGSIKGTVSKFLHSQGFVSAFEEYIACGGENGGGNEGGSKISSTGKSPSPSRWISHLNHHGRAVQVEPCLTQWLNLLGFSAWN